MTEDLENSAYDKAKPLGLSRRKFGTVLSANVVRASGSESQNLKRVKVRRTSTSSLKKKSDSSKSKREACKEKSVTFLPGPVGLQIEPVSGHPHYCARVVRFVDGGPNFPGQARKAASIKPGDFVVKAEAANTVGKTYEDIIRVLKRVHSVRELTFFPAWDQEFFDHQPVLNPKENSTSSQLGLFRRTTTNTSNASRQQLILRAEAKSSNHSFTKTQTEDSIDSLLQEVPRTTNIFQEFPLPQQKADEKSENLISFQERTPIGREGENCEIIEFSFSQNPTDLELAKSPKSMLDDGPIIIHMPEAKNILDGAITTNDEFRIHPSPSRIEMTRNAHSEKPSTIVHHGNEMTTPNSLQTKSPILLFARENSENKLANVDRKGASSIYPVCTTQLAPTAKSQSLPHMLDVFYKHVIPSYSTANPICVNISMRSASQSSTSTPSDFTDDHTISGESFNMVPGIENINEGIAGHGLSGYSNWDVRDVTTQEIQQSMELLVEENAILRREFEKKLELVRLEHLKTERDLKGIYSAMVEQRDERIQELEAITTNLKNVKMFQNLFAETVESKVSPLLPESSYQNYTSDSVNKIKYLEERLAFLESKIKSKDTQLQELTKSSQAREQEMNAEIMELQLENTSINESAMRLRMQLEMRTKDFESATSFAASLGSTNDDIETGKFKAVKSGADIEVDGDRDERRTYQLMIDRLDKDLVGEQYQNRETKNRLVEIQNELQNLKQRSEKTIQDLECIIATKDRLLATQTISIDSLREQNENLGIRKDKLLSKLDEMCAEKLQIQEELHRKQRELEQTKNELDSTQSNLLQFVESQNLSTQSIRSNVNINKKMLVDTAVNESRIHDLQNQLNMSIYRTSRLEEAMTLLEEEKLELETKLNETVLSGVARETEISSQFESRLEAATQEKESIVVQRDEIQVRCDQLEKELSERAAQIAELGAKTTSLESERAELQAECQMALVANNNLELKVVDLNRQLTELLDLRSQDADELCTTKLSFEQLLVNHDELCMQLRIKDREIASARKYIMVQENEKAVSESLVHDLQNQLNMSIYRTSRLEEAMTLLEEEKLELETKLNETVLSGVARETEISSQFESRLEAATQEKESIVVQRDEIQVRCDQLEKELSERAAQIAELGAKTTSLESERAELQAECQMALVANNNLELKVVDLNRQLTELLDLRSQDADELCTTKLSFEQLLVNHDELCMQLRIKDREIASARKYIMVQENEKAVSESLVHDLQNQLNMSIYRTSRLEEAMTLLEEEKLELETKLNETVLSGVARETEISSQFESRLEAATQEKESIVVQRDEIQVRCDQLEKELSERAAQIAELGAITTSLESERAELQAECQMALVANNNLELKVVDLNRQLTELLDLRSQDADELCTTKLSFEQLLVNHDELCMQLCIKDREIASARKYIMVQENEKAVSESLVHDLQNQLNMSIYRTSRLEEAMTLLEEEKLELETKLNETVLSGVARETEISSQFESRLEAATQEKESIVVQRDEIQVRCDQLEKELSERAAQIAELGAITTSLESERAELQAECQMALVANNNLELKVVDLNRQLTELLDLRSQDADELCTTKLSFEQLLVNHDELCMQLRTKDREIANLIDNNTMLETVQCALEARHRTLPWKLRSSDNVVSEASAPIFSLERDFRLFESRSIAEMAAYQGRKKCLNSDQNELRLQIDQYCRDVTELQSENQILHESLKMKRDSCLTYRKRCLLLEIERHELVAMKVRLSAELSEMTQDVSGLKTLVGQKPISSLLEQFRDLKEKLEILGVMNQSLLEENLALTEKNNKFTEIHHQAKLELHELVHKLRTQLKHETEKLERVTKERDALRAVGDADRHKSKHAIVTLAKSFKKSADHARKVQEKFDTYKCSSLKNLFEANVMIASLRAKLPGTPSHQQVQPVPPELGSEHEKLVMWAAQLTVTLSQARKQESILEAKVAALETSKVSLEKELLTMQKAIHAKGSMSADGANQENLAVLKGAHEEERKRWTCELLSLRQACVLSANRNAQLTENLANLERELTSLKAGTPRKCVCGRADEIKRVYFTERPQCEEILETKLLLQNSTFPSKNASADTGRNGIKVPCQKHCWDERKQTVLAPQLAFQFAGEVQGSITSYIAGLSLVHSLLDKRRELLKAGAFRQWACYAVTEKTSSDKKEVLLALSEELKVTRQKIITLKTHHSKRVKDTNVNNKSNSRLRSLLLATRG